jgi:hypothetical protein
MIDDLIEIVGAAAADIAIDKTAQKRRWVRALKAISGLLILALIAGAIYVTVKYS